MELDDDDDTVDMFACLSSKTAHRMLFRQLRLLNKNKQVWLHAGQSNEEYFLSMRTLKEENDKLLTHFEL